MKLLKHRLLPHMILDPPQPFKQGMPPHVNITTELKQVLAQMSKRALSTNGLNRAWPVCLGAYTIALQYKLDASLLLALQVTRCVASSSQWALEVAHISNNVSILQHQTPMLHISSHVSMLPRSEADANLCSKTPMLVYAQRHRCQSVLR